MQDLTGQRFGRLTVIRQYGRNSRGNKTWECICDCGNMVYDTASHLKTMRTSCGCKKKEGTHRTHSGKHERLYGVWINMKQRCLNPNHRDSKYYSDKGITVCEEWKNSYEAFRDWSLNNGYDPDAPRGKTTIDRIDGNKGYSPDNCRWVDAHVQRVNQNRPFEHKNELER